MLPLLALAILWPGAPSAPVFAHPLHTALAEITYQPAERSALIRVRVFRDDLSAALTLPADSVLPDSTLSSYLRGTLALADAGGRPLGLRWEGAERSGDTIILQAAAPMLEGLQHARILAAILWERFPDQVNIVRATYGGRTVTLLFTRGDPAKTFP
jgi:hypothetical protein